MSTDINRISDSHQREQALDICRSVCVQAPAGSGKTGLLTQRILKLLAVCDQPENILAITFTRKAAAEMRDRLITLLTQARDTDKDSGSMNDYDRFNHDLATEVLARDRQQQWQLLKNPSRLQIMTIDSFNSYLATRLSLLSGFGAQPSILEPSDTLYEQAVLELFRKLETDEPVATSLSIMLQHFGNNLNQVQALLSAMLGKRDQWLRHVVGFRTHTDNRVIRDYIESSIRHLIEERLVSICHHLNPWIKEIMNFLAYSRQNLLQEDESSHPLCSQEIPAGTPGTTCSQLSLWKAIAGMLLTTQGSLRKTTDKRNGFPVSNALVDKKTATDMKNNFKALLVTLGEQPGLAEDLAEIPYLPESDFENEQWQVLTAVSDILFHLSGLLDLEFQKHSQCDYTQVSLAALQSLGEDENPTSTALLMDYKIQHILVDEFQDTSHLQIELLEKLTRGWQPGDGRTLFIVGDPMQSCYGFRNAVVGLFLTTRDQGLGNLMLDDVRLGTNFRSDAALIRWINDTFEKAFPAEDEPGRGAVKYTRADSSNEDSAHSGIHCHLLTTQEDADFNKLALADAEARHIVSVIHQIRQNTPDDSIALLVKNRAHLKQILPALKQANITWNASDLDPLSAWQDIRDLLTLCRALLNPADRTAWLALLRTPFVGLELHDILAISQSANDLQQTLSHWLLEERNTAYLSADGQMILDRTVPVLGYARMQRQRLSLRDWLEETWVLLGGPACLHESLEGAHLESFFSLLEEESELADIIDFEHFEKRLETTRIDSHGGPDTRLEIMTIHKAKGLEFDHVLLPCLNDGGRSDQSQILQWQEALDSQGESSLLLSVPASKGADANSLHTFISRESKARTHLEQARLLYIGITRAKKSVWLSACLKREKSGAPVCSSNTLISHIWKTLQPLEDKTTLVCVEHSEADSVTDSPDEKTILTRRLPASWHSGLSLPVPNVIEDEPEQQQMNEALLFNKAERCRGDIIHECLQLMASDSQGCHSDLSSQEKIWFRKLASCTDNPAPYVEEIKQQIDSIRNSQTAAWILSNAHEWAECELSVSDYRGPSRREYIIDRLFTENNTCWIIDYKTANPAGNMAHEDFLAVETARYRPQLLRYAELATVMYPQYAVKTALYFTSLDRLVELN